MAPTNTASLRDAPVTTSCRRRTDHGRRDAAPGAPPSSSPSRYSGDWGTAHESRADRDVDRDRHHCDVVRGIDQRHGGAPERRARLASFSIALDPLREYDGTSAE